MKDPASQCGKSRNLNAACRCYEEPWRSNRKGGDCCKRRQGRRVEPAAIATQRADCHAAIMAAGVCGLNPAIDDADASHHLGSKNGYSNPSPHRSLFRTDSTTILHHPTTCPAIHLTSGPFRRCDLRHTCINHFPQLRVLYFAARLSYIKGRGRRTCGSYGVGRRLKAGVNASALRFDLPDAEVNSRTESALPRRHPVLHLRSRPRKELPTWKLPIIP